MNLRRGSGLIVANAILFIVTAIALFVLEKILPISQATRGVENSNLAYYQAQAGSEGTLMQLSRTNAFAQPIATGSTNGMNYDVRALALTSTIPASNEGNSDYDQNWNKIGPNDPVQLVLTGGIDWSRVKFSFRVPNLDGDVSTTETLSGGYYTTVGTGIITWSLSSPNGNFLNPVDEVATISFTAPGNAGNIRDSSFGTGTYFSISARQGRDQNSLADNTRQFGMFYGQAAPSGPACSNATLCTLRLSVIKPLMTSSGQIIPYLEYNIDFTTASASSTAIPLPDRYIRVAGRGVAFGFRRDIEKKIPQATAVQGLDVTVFN